MKRWLGLCLASMLPLVGPGLWALDWPLGEPKPLSYFGTASSGQFATGMSLGGSASLVKAVDGGDLVFSCDGRTMGANGLPSTLGSWVAVEHARGIVGVYAGLAEGSVATYLDKVKKDDVLGVTGSSGWARAERLDLQLFDRGAGRWVNPLLLLPPLEDKIQPVARAAWLSRDGKTWPLGETRTLPQGQYTVVVELADPLGPAPAPASPAPYYVRLVVDGAKAAELSFDVIAAGDGEFRVSSSAPRSFGECWVQEGRLTLATRLFPRGRSTIQVLVRDYAGNERQVGWAISLE